MSHSVSGGSGEPVVLLTVGDVPGPPDVVGAPLCEGALLPPPPPELPAPEPLPLPFPDPLPLPEELPFEPAPLALLLVPPVPGGFCPSEAPEVPCAPLTTGLSVCAGPRLPEQALTTLLATRASSPSALRPPNARGGASCNLTDWYISKPSTLTRRALVAACSRTADPLQRSDVLRKTLTT